MNPNPRPWIGVTWGDPFSAGTYSGVPYHLFRELEAQGRLAGRLNTKRTAPGDLLHGVVDWRRSLAARRPRRNAFWRYLPENIERLSARLAPDFARLPPEAGALQIGVAGLPPAGRLLAAHVEITIETAAASRIFAPTYGFARANEALLRRAIAGERAFLERCALVWTNTEWTARGLRAQGVGEERLWVHAPGCGMADPGPIERDWRRPRVLFVGKVWADKGGPLTLDAFRRLRHRFPDAQLTIVGCAPALAEPGVQVLGFLNKQDPAAARRLTDAYRDATVFCMPSHWESAGIVYMEALLYGLPVVMLAGQGRDAVFPASMAVGVADPAADAVAEALIALADEPDRAAQMGRAGRRHVLANLTWPVVAGRLLNRLDRIHASDAAA